MNQQPVEKLYESYLNRSVKMEQSAQSSTKSAHRYWSSVDSKLCSNSEFYQASTTYVENSETDALTLLKAKKKYLDKLPITEEDKRAILKHHLDKKRIKDSRVKKVRFQKNSIVNDLNFHNF